ncbi:hypothetical protein [Actinomyces minihominis]|uniref:hypothetical protein n=1 Tax=Actinomyces minihominis TaxID=2002838 RepID=UPI000C07B28E|nr:hypothetical protein [Actinomyces minihominis]
MTASRSQQVPWARRIISTAILLALLIGLIFGITKGVQWVMGILGEEHAKVTESAAPKPVEILPCAGDDLGVRLTPSSGVVDEGIGFTLGVQLENTGKVDCSVETSEVDIKLAGATTVVWSPSACDADWSKTLLLAPGDTWEGSLTWNGHIYEGCDAVAAETGGATASQGTYTLTALAPGASTPQTVSIQIR